SLVRMNAVFVRTFLLVNDFTDRLLDPLLDAGAIGLVPVTAPQLLIPLLKQHQLRTESVDADSSVIPLFENSPDLIFAKNQDGVFTYANQIAATIFKYSLADIIGCTNRELMTAREAAFLDRLEQQALLGNIVSQKMPDDGNQLFRNTFIYLIPLRQQNKSVQGVLGFVTQTNAQKNAEERLTLTLEGAIQAITAIVEQRDPYTSGHQKRVSEISVAIAEKMKLPPVRIEGLRLGAMMHDVGKASLPAEILCKPGLLSPAETRIMQTHPVLGANILRQIPFPWDLARFVEEHHENVDGSGYPKGLAGNKISLEARIISVADSVDSISTHRPYRPAKKLEQAIADLERLKGQKYDTIVVKVLLELVVDGYFMNSTTGGPGSNEKKSSH
ncbi:MEKHLA domain-containing protein, partial [bacterium]|nr:MEKHLA domain-containing protein [bacterium]